MACLLFAAATTVAQKTIDTPPTDTSVQSSPLKPAPKAPVVDDSMQSSPIPEPKSSNVFLPPHTAVPIALNEAIDSGKLKNGQTVHAKLTAAVTAHGKSFSAGTPVELTVVGTVPAGKLNAEGEFSLQVESVGGVHAYTDTQTFRGKPGHRDVAATGRGDCAATQCAEPTGIGEWRCPRRTSASRLIAQFVGRREPRRDWSKWDPK